MTHLARLIVALLIAGAAALQSQTRVQHSGHGAPFRRCGRRFRCVCRRLFAGERSCRNPQVRRPRQRTVDAGVYVLATTEPENRFILRKYSATGNELWFREPDFAFPGDLAADATGVYVAGRDFPPNRTYLRKYRSDGSELWTNRWGGPDNLDNPWSVITDESGVVYVFGIAGRCAPPQPTSYLSARKFDARDTELWNRDLGVPEAALTCLHRQWIGARPARKLVQLQFCLDGYSMEPQRSLDLQPTGPCLA